MDSTGISDLSTNHYAAVMRGLAEGFSGWAGLLLLPFLLYQIFSHETATIFSLKAFLVILVAEIVFVLAAKLANVLLASILAACILPFAMKNKTTLAQNIENTILAVFGLFLCIAAWVFAGNAVNYAYSSSSNIPDGKIVSNDPYSSEMGSYPEDWQPKNIKCIKYDYIPDFTLGYYSDPRVDEIKLLCSCIDQRTKHDWVKETGRKMKKGEKVTNVIYREAFPAKLGETIQTCTQNARREKGQQK